MGVSQSASHEEIKAAYRKLSKKFHPDVNQGDLFFAERFKEINEAYEILSDIVKRKRYDLSFFGSKNYKVEYETRDDDFGKNAPKEPSPEPERKKPDPDPDIKTPNKKAAPVGAKILTAFLIFIFATFTLVYSGDIDPPFRPC